MNGIKPRNEQETASHTPDYAIRIETERNRLLMVKKSLQEQLIGIENQLYILDRVLNPEETPGENQLPSDGHPTNTDPNDTPPGTV